MSFRNTLLLATGVVAVSFAAIFIRYAEAPALTIALYRQAIAALIVLPLALVGALAAAVYFLTGRRLRRDVSLLAYVAVVYATCAVLLLPVAVVGGARLTGFDGQTWIMFVLLALIPQTLGHTVFNYVLKDVSATVVAISIMGEPIGSTLLALAFFGEMPPWTAVAGGALILAGIYVAVTAQAKLRRPVEPAPAVTPLE